jgi:hypothetical protein
MAVGTNVISDSYIDFGVAGVIAGLFAIGLFAKAIRNYAARDPYDPRRVIIYLLTLASLAELPRYAIDLPIRILVWAVVFCALVGTVTERSRWQASARPGRTTGPRATSAALGHKPGNVARRVGFAIQSEFPQIESGEKS